MRATCVLCTLSDPAIRQLAIHHRRNDLDLQDLVLWRCEEIIVPDDCVESATGRQRARFIRKRSMRSCS